MSPTAPPPKPPRAAKVAAVSTTSAAQPSSPTLSYQGPPPSSASAPPSPTVTVRKRPPKYQLPPEFGAKYAVRDELGIGGYGYIFSALRKKDGKEVAVKLLPREYVAPNRWTMDPGLGPVPMELWVMKNVVHPGIVQFYDLYQNKDVLLIVMELFGNSWKNLPYNNSNPTVPQPADQFLTAGNGNNASSSKPAEDIIPILGTIPSRRRSSDLFELLEVNALTEHEVHAIFVQLVDTLEHLYTYHGIIHGDIKDENVLVARLQNGEVKVKLIDFGAAVRVRPGRYHHTHREDSDDASASDADLLNPAADCSCGKRLSGQTFCGTLEFAPPEVLKGDPFYDGERAQIWSVGVLLYDMLYRCMPFADVQAAISKPFAKNPTVEVSPSCIDLLEKLLQKDPVARLPLEEIKNHPWFVQGPAKAA
ncbi:kinase-like domain-containing protein [Cladochytrium replicatum]|nr:kinase-like domain-containing protein [Cladochytrium replicatum]